MAKRRKHLESIVRHAHLLSLVLRHPNVPWLAKTVAGCAVAYLLSPIQLIPTFIPVVGQMDDLLVLFVGMKLVHKLTPAAILEECEAKSGSPWPVQSESRSRRRSLNGSPKTRRGITIKKRVWAAKSTRKDLSASVPLEIHSTAGGKNATRNSTMAVLQYL